MDLYDQQRRNEYLHSGAHLVDTFKAEGSLLNTVNTLKDRLESYFSKTDFSYTLKDGTKKNWDTQEYRYEVMHTDANFEQIAWKIVIACTQAPKTQLTSVVGRIKASMPLDGIDALHLASEAVGVFATMGGVNIVPPKHAGSGSLELTSNIELSEELTKYMEQRRFVLPSLVPPEIVDNNEMTGYLTIPGSILTKGRHHEKRLNLRHINRLNQIPLCIDSRIYQSVEPTYSPSDKPDVDPIKHRASWERMTKESVGILAYLSNKTFYVTHRYDERERTYTNGYHINLQGQDYQRAGVELANKELIIC